MAIKCQVCQLCNGLATYTFFVNELMVGIDQIDCYKNIETKLTIILKCIDQNDILPKNINNNETTKTRIISKLKYRYYDFWAWEIGSKC